VRLVVDQVPDVAVPPIALFSASETRGTAPLTVQFDGSDSFDPEDQALSYAWTFGDGGEASGIAPAHTYTQPGEYIAELRVVDEDGESDTFESDPIVVEAPPLPGPSESGSDSDGGATGSDPSSSAVNDQGARLADPKSSPGIALFARIARARGRLALIRARCLGDAACRGSATLIVRRRVVRRAVKRGGKRRVVRRLRNILVGRGRFNVAPAQTGVARIRLTRAGRRLLRRSGRRGLRAKLVGQNLRPRAVKVRRRVPAKRKRARTR
jgi:hypothetical protein